MHGTSYYTKIGNFVYIYVYYWFFPFDETVGRNDQPFDILFEEGLENSTKVLTFWVRPVICTDLNLSKKNKICTDLASQLLSPWLIAYVLELTMHVLQVFNYMQVQK